MAAKEHPVPKHIGIVAVSPEGSALCYRDIFRYASHLVGDTGHPLVSLHNEPFELYMSAVLRDDWHAIGDLLVKSATALASIGAEFAITPDNVMQHAVHLAETHSPIPWLKMTDLVAEAVVADRRKVVGVIGTKMVMYGSTYQTQLGLRGVKVIAPEAADADAVDGIIFRELVHGVATAESRQVLVDIIQRMMGRGAEGVILGSTEIPLLIDVENAPVAVYDSTQILAEGAVRVSLGMNTSPAPAGPA
jgi:aspartate racemase